MRHARVRCVGVIQIGEDFSKLPVSKINDYFAKFKRAHNVNEPCPHLSFSRKAKGKKTTLAFFISLQYISIFLNKIFIILQSSYEHICNYI